MKEEGGPTTRLTIFYYWPMEERVAGKDLHKDKKEKRGRWKIMESVKTVYEGERFLESIYTPTEDGTCRSYFTPDGEGIFGKRTITTESRSRPLYHSLQCKNR